MNKSGKYTRAYDYALRMFGRTGNKKYVSKMASVEKTAKKAGYSGRWARNSRGNNKMYRFTKRR